MNLYVYSTDAGWLGGKIVVLAETNSDAFRLASDATAKHENFMTGNPAIVVALVCRADTHHGEFVMTIDTGDY